MQSNTSILDKRDKFPNLATGTSYITREGGALITSAAGSMGTINDKWTIATWIKRQRQTASTETFFILRETPLSLAGEINFGNWVGANELRFTVRSTFGTAPNVYEILDVPAFDLNADWEFFVFTYDYNGGTVLQDFYYDGTLLNETAGSGVGDPYLDHVTVGNPEQNGDNRYISIGNFITNDPPGLEGQIFNWSMWDRVLSAEEVSALYNGGNGFVVDYTANRNAYSSEGLNFHYTFENGANRGENFGSVALDLADDEQGLATYTVDDLPGKNDPTVYMSDSMSFMLNPGAKSNAHHIASDDLFSTIFPSDLNTFSFSLWYKTMPGITPTAFDSIMGSTTNWNNWTDGFGLYWNNGGTQVRFFVNDYNTAANYINGTLLGTHWHNIVGVYDGPNTTLSLYDQGQLIGQNTSAISANILRTGTQNFYLGRLGNANFSTTTWGAGFYNEVALFDKVLSDAEIKSLYNMGVPGSPSGMSPRLWWRMEESLGDQDFENATPVVNDQSGNSFDGTPTKGTPNTGDGEDDIRLVEDRPTFQSVSAEFVSSSDYIETKSISPYLGYAGDWTATCWCKPTGTPAASDEAVIFETTDPSDESVFRAYIDDNDDLHIKLWDNAGTLFKHYTSNVQVFNSNEWHYLCIVFTASGSVLTVYQGYEFANSVTELSALYMDKTVDNAGTMSNEGPQTIRLGNNAAHDTNYPGLIYSMSLWGGDLTKIALDELAVMRSSRSPVSGNYGNYTFDSDFDYHYDWRDQYFIGDNRNDGKTSPSIDTSVGGVWPPVNTDVPPRAIEVGG